MQFHLTTTLVVALWTAGSMFLPDAAASQNKSLPGVQVSASGSGTGLAGMVLREDDIFVGRTTDFSGTPQSRGISLSNSLSLWLDGIVPYEIDAGVTAHGRQVVAEAVEHWNQRSSITLVDRTRVSDSGPDYVRFISGPGCASWVGRQGGGQEVWVSDYCTAGSMIHEIGHALGLLHEHTRADRDQYIQVLWSNIQSDKMFNFEISNSGTQDLGPYDYDSVMHYGEFFFSSNGEKTLIPVRDVGQSVIGQRVAASAGDLASIDGLYQTDLALTTQEFVDNDQRELQLRVSNQGSNGAHELAITITGAGNGTVFAGDEGWSCASVNAELQCTLPRLSAGADSQVTVQIPADIAIDTVSSSLTSKTHDGNRSNNRIGGAAEALPDEPDTGEAVGPALGDDRVNLAALGGTSNPWFWLLLVLPLALLRRPAVLACGASTVILIRADAPTDTATPPGRTSR
ncbi:MAG: M12 family metallopeptidase [Gammaproteobacteria bacterium]|nr:M12 family metallopeptidase [Gammaproteobacteria bacterium]